MATQRGTARWKRILELMNQLEWQAAERLLLDELAKAEQRGDLSLVAQCYSNLGNVAEANDRVGDAFRHWSSALDLLTRLGSTKTGEAERLRRLLRLWHEMPRVWVSYSHDDTERVEPVLGALRRAGIEVMYDKAFLAGHSIQRQVLEAIERCPKGIVFFSSVSKESEWVKYEIEVLKRQRHENLSRHALDNITIFYCLDADLPPNEFSDDLQIVEGNLGFVGATTELVRSIKTSEVLAIAS
jgi:hypothetical protein